MCIYVDLILSSISTNDWLNEIWSVLKLLVSSLCHWIVKKMKLDNVCKILRLMYDIVLELLNKC